MRELSTEIARLKAELATYKPLVSSMGKETNRLKDALAQADAENIVQMQRALRAEGELAEARSLWRDSLLDLVAFKTGFLSMVKRSGELARVTAERDEWKAKHAETVGFYQDVVQQLDSMRSKRDALQADKDKLAKLVWTVAAASKIIRY